MEFSIITMLLTVADGPTLRQELQQAFIRFTIIFQINTSWVMDIKS